MSARPARRALALAALTALAALAALPVAGCGRRGAPVAPELRVPAAVTDLTGTVTASGIELRWTNPTRRADGTRLRQLEAVRVFRVEDTGAGEPRVAFLERGRIHGYDEIAAIRLTAPAPAVIEGSRVTFVDRRQLVLGRRYTYVVLAEDAEHRVSVPSMRRTLAFIAAPDAPRGLVAEAGEGQARLTWRAPARLVDGQLPGRLEYEVLRGAGENVLAPVPNGRVAENEYTDRGLENDRTYYYAVRAIRSEGGTVAASDPTAPVRVTPVDLTPPSPPRDLVAIPGEGVVRLSWSESLTRDVARYVVYRAPERGAPVRIGSVTPPATTFVDRDVPSGRHRYTVTAEDASARRNESARSNEVVVSVP